MQKNRKTKSSYIGFFQAKKTVSTITRHLLEHFIFQNLLKNRKLFPAEKFGNILVQRLLAKIQKENYSHLYRQTVLSKILS